MRILIYAKTFFSQDVFFCAHRKKVSIMKFHPNKIGIIVTPLGLEAPVFFCSTFLLNRLQKCCAIKTISVCNYPPSLWCGGSLLKKGWLSASRSVMRCCGSYSSMRAIRSNSCRCSSDVLCRYLCGARRQVLRDILVQFEI